MPVKIMLIAKGSSRNACSIAAHLAKRTEVVLRKTSQPGQIPQFIEDGIKTGVTHAIVIGGDGSLHDLVNAVMLLPTDTTKPVIGQIPAGTGNDFAKTAGWINFNSSSFIPWVQSTPLDLDLGVIHCQNRDGKAVVRYFVNIADVGIGGYIAERLPQNKSALTYVWQTIKGFCFYRPTEMHLSTENASNLTKSMGIVLANAKYFANGICIAPEAIVNDGNLELIHLKNISLTDYFLNLGNLLRGKKIHHSQVSYAQTRSCEIHSEHPLPIDADGELAGYTPGNFSVLHHALKMLPPIPA